MIYTKKAVHFCKDLNLKLECTLPFSKCFQLQSPQWSCEIAGIWGNFLIELHIQPEKYLDHWAILLPKEFSQSKHNCVNYTQFKKQTTGSIPETPQQLKSLPTLPHQSNHCSDSSQHSCVLAQVFNFHLKVEETRI